MLFADRQSSVVLALATRAAAVLFSLALISPALPAWAQDSDPVVARVNGTEIRASDLTMIEEEVGSSLQPMPPEARRDYLITLLSDTILVAQEGEKKKLADTPDFKRRLMFLRSRLLSEAVLQDEAKSAVTEAALRQLYDEAVKQMGTEKEVRARHILFGAPDDDQQASDAAKAKVVAVIARLKNGEDFAKLATELTEDPSGRENGGDLGYFTKDRMVPEFAEVAFKLEPGMISEPVRTQFGWHVLKVEDKRDRAVPEFEMVKDQLEKHLVRKSQSELVTRLRASAKIEKIDAKPDATSGATAAAPAAPSAPAAPK